MDAPPILPAPAVPQPPKLLEQLRQRIRVLHYSIRTEQAYVDWARRFILCRGSIKTDTLIRSYPIHKERLNP